MDNRLIPKGILVNHLKFFAQVAALRTLRPSNT